MIESGRLHRAWWEAANWGRIALASDWDDPKNLPPIAVRGGKLTLKREQPIEYAKLSGYYVEGDWVVFVAKLENAKEKVYLSGDFNNWEGFGRKNWQLQGQKIDGDHYGVLKVRQDTLGDGRLFKFVNQDDVWREPAPEAPNVAYENNARNHYIDPMRTGAHLFRFDVAAPLDWIKVNELLWQNEMAEEVIMLSPGNGFYQMESKAEMGAILEGGRTRFTLFAPRATQATVYYKADATAKVQKQELRRQDDGSWTTQVTKKLEGYLYVYRVDGPKSVYTNFDPKMDIVDPWAVCLKDGWGVVVDKAKVLRNAPAPFAPPPYEELIVAEAHVQDMIAKAPLEMTDDEKRGFRGVKKLLKCKQVCDPLENLGVTAVELQPIMQFDGDGKSYHWGYMTTNFFAPAAEYAGQPEKLSQIEDVQQMVSSFHSKGMAVIMDVVFNHVGVPAYLLFLDKAYYFNLSPEGHLTNWSGCGNDLRVDSAMARRLCLDALEWWVRAYGVDGFRFDLGELLGVDFLSEVQHRLRKIKPDLILICEPWSFRGHLGGSLKPLDYASWNDGLREYLPKYLKGKEDPAGLKYFVSGSTGHMTARPTQSLNYVESHDDRTWLDKITENKDHNGFFPTLRDRRLTHMMAATLMMSLGVPMIALGQEGMRSKYGVNNTYQRGDLNAYDYARVREYPGTMEYFRDLIALRKSTWGKALRVNNLDENYLKFYQQGNALGVLYNAEMRLHAKRMLFVINPEAQTTQMELPDLDAKRWVQVADYERVKDEGLKEGNYFWKNNQLELPPVSVAIFVEDR